MSPWELGRCGGVMSRWQGHVREGGQGAWLCTVSRAGVEKETHLGVGGDFEEMKEGNLRPSRPQDPDQHHSHLGAWETPAASSRQSVTSVAVCRLMFALLPSLPRWLFLSIFVLLGARLPIRC